MVSNFQIYLLGNLFRHRGWVWIVQNYWTIEDSHTAAPNFYQQILELHYHLHIVAELLLIAEPPPDSLLTKKQKYLNI